ncbi:MAG: hypothetical protein HWE16_03045 [Gammaproteobacteria bacterium]|nr:hypothetical protein [Gammaproteobacteria bacterium]
MYHEGMDGKRDFDLFLLVNSDSEIIIPKTKLTMGCNRKAEHLDKLHISLIHPLIQEEIFSLPLDSKTYSFKLSLADVESRANYINQYIASFDEDESQKHLKILNLVILSIHKYKDSLIEGCINKTSKIKCFQDIYSFEKPVLQKHYEHLISRLNLSYVEKSQLKNKLIEAL